ncbi:MAG: hydrogenase iron-sulfur subunit [Candidatus Zixiibacteriota bacterium]
MAKKYEPRIIGFLCNWCTYTGADLAGTSRLQYPPTHRTIRVMCSSRVDPLFIIKAVLRGADGILVGGCHPGDCHYQKGNYYTRRRFALLKKIFDTYGLDSERIRLSWISASEGPRFQQVITEYTKKLSYKGPNKIRKEVFL